MNLDGAASKEERCGNITDGMNPTDEDVEQKQAEDFEIRQCRGVQVKWAKRLNERTSVRCFTCVCVCRRR